MTGLTDPMLGTITSGATMRGVHAGAGVNRGGQQGRPRSLTGGLPGVKHPIPNAKGSQPAPAVSETGPAPAPTTAPQSVPRSSPTAVPEYSWWRPNALAQWQRYISSWKEPGQ